MYGLQFFCQGCSHGGHQECYRKYITTHPPIQHRPPPKVEVPTTPDGSSMLPRTRSFAVGGFSSRASSTYGPSPAIASLVDIQQHLTRDGSPGPSPPSISKGSPPSEEGSRSEQLGLPRSWISSVSGAPPMTESPQVRYHACPSGCGHYCWAATVPS